MRVLGRGVKTLPNTLNVAFPGIKGESLMMRMDLKGFAVSTGSACSTGSVEPSPVIRAMGYSDREALESVRISMGRFTTEGDVAGFVDQLLQEVAALSAVA